VARLTLKIFEFLRKYSDFVKFAGFLHRLSTSFKKEASEKYAPSLLATNGGKRYFGI